MKNFIKLYDISEKEIITININSISNYKKVNHTDGSYSIRVVYTNTGLVNSEMKVKETINEIDNLILIAQN
tara:strand:+ start:345 stop:557 length:213 start_codon:yes stop_codon:yes gene_type:complete